MKIDRRQALRVFNKIVQFGQKHEDEYRLDGLSARAEQDGYTVVLRDEVVTLRIFFHHSFDLDYRTRKAWKTFQLRVDHVDSSRYGASNRGQSPN